MRNSISYEMQMMFVGSSGAFEASSNTGQKISRLDFIQSYDFSFNIDRQALKQVGSNQFASRQTQLAPDVELNLSYLLNDGWNEKYIGLDFTTGAYSNPLQTVFSSTGDKNFYVLISQDQYQDSNADTSAQDYNVLGIGNAFITSYEIALSVGGMASVNCNFAAANASVTNYTDSRYVPAVNVGSTGETAEMDNVRYGIDFLDNSRSSRYGTGFTNIFDSGCSFNGASISATSTTVSGMKFGFDFDNFQSFQLSLPFERKALYGFGSNYPTTRKIQIPVVATMSVDSLVDTFEAENLAESFKTEDVTTSGYDFNVVFKNPNNVEKLGIKIQNARLESYSLGAQIGNRTFVQTSWTFEVSPTTGILMSGSFGTPALSSVYINESINP